MAVADAQLFRDLCRAQASVRQLRHAGFDRHVRGAADVVQGAPQAATQAAFGVFQGGLQRIGRRARGLDGFAHRAQDQGQGVHQWRAFRRRAACCR